MSKLVNRYIRPVSPIAWIVIAAMGVCYFFGRLGCPLMGDDLWIQENWGFIAEKRGWLAYPYYVAYHFKYINGRLAENLAPLHSAILPHWATALIIGILAMAFLYVIVRMATRYNRFKAIQGLIVALCVLTLPWWDSMLLAVTWSDYVTGTLVTLLYLVYFSKVRRAGWLAIIVSFFIGTLHEAIGLAVMCGFVAYALLNRMPLCNRVRSPRGKLAIAYSIGALLTMASPGIISRMGSEVVDGRDWITVLYTSCFYVILLLIVGASMMLTKSGRMRVRELSHTHWLIYAVAALASSVIAMNSHIIGRTGMFAQVMALIAMCMMVEVPGKGMKKLVGVLSWITGIVAIVSLMQFAWYQRIAGEQLMLTIDDFKTAPDGIVYCDYLTGPELPMLTLRKVTTVPDGDDIWHLHTLSHIYRNEEVPFIVLPTEFKDGELWSEMPLRSDCAVVTDLQLQPIEHDTYERIPIYLADADMLRSQGVEPPATEAPEGYVLQKFIKDGKQYWLITSRDREPGE